MFKAKGLLNNFQKNCTFLSGWLPLAYIDSCHCWELDGEKTLPWNSWFAEVGIVHLCRIVLLLAFLLSMRILNLLLTTSEV